MRLLCAAIVDRQDFRDLDFLVTLLVYGRGADDVIRNVRSLSVVPVSYLLRSPPITNDTFYLPYELSGRLIRNETRWNRESVLCSNIVPKGGKYHANSRTNNGGRPSLEASPFVATFCGTFDTYQQPIVAQHFKSTK